MYKVSYILPEGEQVHIAVCAVKEDGSQIFQMEIQSPYEKGKSLDAYPHGFRSDISQSYVVLVSVKPVPSVTLIPCRLS